MTNVVTLTSIGVDKRLTEVTGQINQGDCVHLLGPNGAGKSTLLSVIAGITPFDNGACTLLGNAIATWPLSSLAGMRCMLGQQNYSAFPLQVSEYLSFYSTHKKNRADVPEIVEAALEVQQFASKALTTLSGGERQRVELCRVLLQVWPAVTNGKAIILLDEPLQGLDIRHQYALVSLLQTLCERGNTVIMSSHDLSMSANYSSHVWLLKQGSVIDSGRSRDVINKDNLETTFDCHFAISKHNNFLEIQACAPISFHQIW